MLAGQGARVAEAGPGAEMGGRGEAGRSLGFGGRVCTQVIKLETESDANVLILREGQNG